jgi:hypothetical protein
MGRPYSDRFLREINAAGDKSLGQQLGEVCIAANLPAAYVAYALNVSRMTIYSWFRGKGVSDRKRAVVEAFIRLAKKDTEAGILPVKSLHEAKKYVEEMVGSTN